MAGTLFLIPTPLGDEAVAWLPETERAKVLHITHFVVEAEKTARRHLKALGVTTPIRELSMQTLNEHTKPGDVAALLAPLAAGHDVGLVSEAGCPAVADPGAQLVALAHERGYRVEPLIGPSSILLALMGSGLSGQHFAFHGYLPAKDDLRHRKIRELENESRREQRTQLFIETPYRNLRLFQALLDACAAQTRLGIATDLTLPSQHIMTMRCGDWKRRDIPPIDKRPTVFLLQA